MPQPLIRLFVSSTFSDFREERRVLQQIVFPQLKQHCESLGARFQAIDLRWGVNEEDGRTHKTMDICLAEVRRCQRLSPRPNFLILSGDRSGWKPVPNRIPEAQWTVLTRYWSDDEKSLAETWFRRDENALPPQWILMPSKEAWQNSEPALHALMERSAHSAHSQGLISDKELIQYTTSATYQEIVLGALDPPSEVVDPKEHVFAYIRELHGVPSDGSAMDFHDGGCEELQAQLHARLPADHLYNYQAQWRPETLRKVDLDRETFSKRVLTDLMAVIDRQLDEQAEVDPLVAETERHEQTTRRLTQAFSGRQHDLTQLHNYLESDTDQPLLLVGAGGSGKSTLMAQAARIHQQTYPDHLTLIRFLATTPESSAARSVLVQLSRTMAQEFGTDIASLLPEDKLNTLEGCRQLFEKALGLATVERPVTVFLDGLDQLEEAQSGLLLTVFPSVLPANVHLVNSVLDLSRSRVAGSPIEYTLPVLGAEDGRAMLQAWLGSVSRKLTAPQEEAVHASFHATGLPLHLKLAFERCRDWKSWDVPQTLPESVGAMISSFFDDLEYDHGSKLVRTALGYLSAGRYGGMAEDEVIGLLAWDEEFWTWLVSVTHPAHKTDMENDRSLRSLPVALWSRLYFDLEPYLVEREAPGGTLLGFFHRLMGEVAVERFVVADETTIHRQIAGWFGTKPVWKDAAWTVPDGRKTAEEIWHHIEAGDWQAARDRLTDFDFYMAKSRAEQTEDILPLIRWFNAGCPTGFKDELKYWEAFFRERAHILRRGNAEWPTYKILLQLAVEHADNSPVTISAEKWLEGGKCGWEWYRRFNIQRPQEPWEDPSISQYETERGMGFRCCSPLPNGGFVVWNGHRPPSLREELRSGFVPLFWILDAQGQIVRQVEIPEGQVLTIVVAPTKSLLVLLKTGQCRVYDIGGKFVSVFGENIAGILPAGDRFLVLQHKTVIVYRHGSLTQEILTVVGRNMNNAALSERGDLVAWWQGEKEIKLRPALNEAMDLVVEGRGQFEEVRIEGDHIIAWTEEFIQIWNRKGIQTAKYGWNRNIMGFEVGGEAEVLIWAGKGNSRITVGDFGGHVSTEFESGQNWVSECRFGPGRSILAWDHDFVVAEFLFDGTCRIKKKIHDDHIFGLVYHPRNLWISWSQDQTLRIWDLGWNLVCTIRGSFYGVQFSGTSLVVAHGENQMNIIDLDLAISNASLTQQGYESGVIPRDDRTFFSWAKDGSLSLWEKEGRLIRRFSAHARAVTGMQELPTGHWMSWSDDCTLKLWTIEGEELAHMVGHQNSIANARCFDNEVIVSWTNWDGELRFWSMEGSLIAVATPFYRPPTEVGRGKGRTFWAWAPAQGHLVQLDFTGQELWRWRMDSWICAVLIHPSGRVFAGIRDQKIQAPALVVLGINGDVELSFLWDWQVTAIGLSPNGAVQVLGTGKDDNRFHVVLCEGSGTEEPRRISDSEYWRLMAKLFGNQRRGELSRTSSECVSADGRRVAIRDGQVCFLQLYRGNQPIPLPTTAGAAP